jgi:hypothetical protein
MLGSFINVIGGMSNTSLIFGRDAALFYPSTAMTSAARRLIAKKSVHDLARLLPRRTGVAPTLRPRRSMNVSLRRAVIRSWRVALTGMPHTPGCGFGRAEHLTWPEPS